MLFLLQFSHKYTVRIESVNGTSAPSPLPSVSQILPLHTPWSTLNSPATAASQEKCGPRRIQSNSTHNEILGGKCSSSQYFRPSFEPKLLVDYYLFIFPQPHWLLKSIGDYVLLTIGGEQL